MSAESLSLDEVQARIARAAVRGAHSYGESGDGTADDRRIAHQLSGRKVQSAAVLIMLLQPNVVDEDAAVVLTQRSAHLHDHPGQISFPGGRRELADADLIATALRETEEEIGADRQQITVLGTLPHYVTVTAYEITPVVAVSPMQVFHTDPFEVENVFTVPLRHILDARTWRRDSFLRAGQRREYWAVPYGERYIWGATAGMLRTFREVLLTP